MQTRAKTARRANWRGRGKAAWRELLDPVGVARLTGRPLPSLEELHVSEIEKLASMVSPRARKTFRALLSVLIRKIALKARDGVSARRR